MKLEHRTVKTGRRVTGHAATLGPIEGTGPTVAEALTAAETAVREALARLDQGLHIGQWQGHTYVVAPDLFGWRYWLDTFSPGYLGNTMTAGTRQAVIHSALHHLAQNLWTPETDDRAFLDSLPIELHSELNGWMSWQRRFASLRAEGLTEDEARRRMDGRL